jgi:hypothetical protein
LTAGSHAVDAGEPQCLQRTCPHGHACNDRGQVSGTHKLRASIRATGRKGWYSQVAGGLNRGRPMAGGLNRGRPVYVSRVEVLVRVLPTRFEVADVNRRYR